MSILAHMDFSVSIYSPCPSVSGPEYRSWNDMFILAFPLLKASVHDATSGSSWLTLKILRRTHSLINTAQSLMTDCDGI